MVVVHFCTFCREMFSSNPMGYVDAEKALTE